MVEAIQSVTVQTQAALTVLAHAKRHVNESVSGILVGEVHGNTVVISDAVPVCHGTPTLPVLETAMGLVEQLKVKIVGWYTAPELLEDDKAGPVALRIAANMASDSLEPVLLVLSNSQIKEGSKLFQGYGRDFGNQWLEKISTETDCESKLGKLLFNDNIPIHDLLDHFADPQRTWYPNPELTKLAQKS